MSLVNTKVKPFKAQAFKAGKFVEVKASFAKAPAGLPLESVPKKVQTYDPFFGPTMEKTVGVADAFHGKLAGISVNVQGRYSSSGRFKLTGP